MHTPHLLKLPPATQLNSPRGLNLNIMSWTEIKYYRMLNSTKEKGLEVKGLEV